MLYLVKLQAENDFTMYIYIYIYIYKEDPPDKLLILVKMLYLYATPPPSGLYHMQLNKSM